MEAWVILDTNDEPIGIRETSQAVCEAVEYLARLHILNNDERTAADAERLVIVPEFDGDRLAVIVFLANERRHPYMLINARKFDSAMPIE